MNLVQTIPERYSQLEFKPIINWIGGSEERFAELMEIFFDGNSRKNQYAASIMIHCVDKWNYLKSPKSYMESWQTLSLLTYKTLRKPLLSRFFR
jgi:hypothetical protein